MKPILGALLAVVALAATPPAGPQARTVRYGLNDIVPVAARIRYTTIIILPETEKIQDFVCGDNEYWKIEGSLNFAYVKPSKAGSRTNLNLVTATGNVYSFMLYESDAEPDMKLFIEPRNEVLVTAAGKQRLFSLEEVDQWRALALGAEEKAKAANRLAEERIRKAGEDAEKKLAKDTTELPSKMQFPYDFQARRKPFMISSMYTDGKFTYIKAEPEEVAALYELRDGKPNLIVPEFKYGGYFIPKILGDGYLQIGRQKTYFRRLEVKQ